jgi:uncharacterized protein (TIGR02265 family)
MFMSDLLELAKRTVPSVDIHARAGLAPRRYVAFLEYPYADLLRLLVATSGAVHPTLPLGEAVRRIGRRAYPTLLESHAGRVVFGALGVDVDKVLEYGPKGYRLAINFARVSSERVEERHFTYSFEGLPAFLETYQVGVIEGAMLHYGVEGTIQVALKDLANATLDVRWR